MGGTGWPGKAWTTWAAWGAWVAAVSLGGAVPGVAGAGVQLDGDLMLGGLFPVHEKGDGTPCSTAVYDRGLQRLEAMLYAVDLINKDPFLLPNVTLGVHILDTCSKDTYALNQSLEFIRVSLNALDTSGLECGDGKPPRVKYRAKPVRGVVGGSYSSVSLQVANLFRLFHIPQVSPASTARALSDKTRYEFFARTVPPDTYQAMAIMDVMQLFNWSYISTIHSEGSYGEFGIEVIHKLAAERNVCIAVSEKIPHNADHQVYNTALANLMKKPSARAVVLFTRAEDAREVLKAARRLNLTSYFHWVASDGWGKQSHLVEGLQEVAEGAITVELTSDVVKGFDTYMSRLTPHTNTRNPWFEEYWEKFFGCHLSSVPGSDLSCGPDLRITKEAGYQQDPKVQFVVDAVYSFAHSLSHLQQSKCPDTTIVCDAMSNYDGGDFYREYLLNVSFKGVVGSQVKFDEVGDGPARYTIYNYRKIPGTSVYNYSVVGSWYSRLDLNLSEVSWANDTTTVPTSVCSHPCQVGEIKIVQQGDTCCWICTPCKDWEMMVEESLCIDCGPGRWPYDNKSSCYDLPHQYMRWTSVFALVPVGISCLGIVLTLTVIGIFGRHDDTPIVKASGRELSYMLLCGILVCYLNTFLLLARPGAVICALQRFGVGFGFSMIYGALLTKTNRISRIFDSASRSARRPGFISPKSQVVITCSLVSVQVVATVVWLVIETPGTRFEYPTREQVILKCRIKDSSFLLSLIYNMFLITTCTVYAVKTRKIPENFNESKFIGFTMYTTCIIWLAFVPIYFGTGNSYEVQITTLCVAISLSASVALFCLYSPKIYIIVFHPDKNVRKLTMNSATYKKSHPLSSAASINHGSEGVKLQTVPGTPSKTATEGGSQSMENEALL
ncbi:metabotropic glutamate receptor-like isoform X2 [Portunus trituberculatus]|uniref:metabotropic glutamate receptor-like isoform X2 n=1 Tax=Portunus trituberculatus TaxID=210409 RepID=UPI001E1D1356|nr:metabotropic glutamate receptor-like isoform X2 [Portunus trituberculatus]